ncbi:NmrA family protein [Seiridium cupressi]
MSSHILVIGATGPTGVEFCTKALDEGHSLTLYVRNPDKLPAKISGNDAVTVIKGTLEDEASLEKAVTSGPTIFVSFAGPVMGSKGTPVTDSLKTIFPLLIANNYKRAMVLATPSFTAPQDAGALKWKLSVLLIKVIGGSAYEEFSGLGAVVSSYDTAQLKWTLFRVPFLGNGPEKPVNATYTGSGTDGMFLSRKSIAAWVLKEMNDGSEWIGKTPVLSN